MQISRIKLKKIKAIDFSVDNASYESQTFSQAFKEDLNLKRRAKMYQDMFSERRKKILAENEIYLLDLNASPGTLSKTSKNDVLCNGKPLTQ